MILEKSLNFHVYLDFLKWVNDFIKYVIFIFIPVSSDALLGLHKGAAE